MIYNKVNIVYSLRFGSSTCYTYVTLKLTLPDTSLDELFLLLKPAPEFATAMKWHAAQPSLYAGGATALHLIMATL